MPTVYSTSTDKPECRQPAVGAFLSACHAGGAQLPMTTGCPGPLIPALSVILLGQDLLQYLAEGTSLQAEAIQPLSDSGFPVHMDLRDFLDGVQLHLHH